MIWSKCSQLEVTPFFIFGRKSGTARIHQRLFQSLDGNEPFRCSSLPRALLPDTDSIDATTPDLEIFSSPSSDRELKGKIFVQRG